MVLHLPTVYRTNIIIMQVPQRMRIRIASQPLISSVERKRVALFNVSPLASQYSVMIQKKSLSMKLS